MEKRSLLDEIEDLDFAIHQFIHKGKSKDEVIAMLRKRGVDDAKMEEHFRVIDNLYQGVARIQCGKTKRGINFFVDLTLVGGIVGLVYLLFPALTFNEKMLIDFVFGMLLVYLIPEAVWGRTPGKLLTNTIVVDKNGKIPHFLWILIRSILRYNPYHSAIYAFSNDRPKHDCYSRTYVVCKKRWEQLYAPQRTGF